jgi:hypothetical protein
VRYILGGLHTDPLAGEKHFVLHGMGTGLRYPLFPNLNAQISYGWQLRDSGSNDCRRPWPPACLAASELLE